MTQHMLAVYPDVFKAGAAVRTTPPSQTTPPVSGGCRVSTTVNAATPTSFALGGTACAVLGPDHGYAATHAAGTDRLTRS